MKKNILWKIILFTILIIFVVGGYLAFNKISNKSTSRQEEKNTLNVKTPEEMLIDMSLEDKVGQMLMVGFWGIEPDYYINKMINQRNVGGVILMKYNFDNQEQAKNLINTLQQKSLDTDPGIPMFISVDQEGGLVSRVQLDGISELTAQSDIKSSEQAYTVADKRAKELKQLGININYSPVVDYVKNENSFLYERTFRGNIDSVGGFASEMVRGYQNNGLISVIKHFLGHPDTNIDPHLSVLEADFTNQEIMDRTKIFRRVIADVSPYMVMTSHVIYKNIDSETPCSLSKKCIQEWLRGESRFGSGIVITDDMEMGAIQDKYSNAEAAVMAIKAGNDILLYTSTPEKQAEAYDAIIEAVNNNEINVEQINDSVLKILKLKKKIINNEIR